MRLVMFSLAPVATWHDFQRDGRSAVQSGVINLRSPRKCDVDDRVGGSGETRSAAGGLESQRSFPPPSPGDRPFIR